MRLVTLGLIILFLSVQVYALDFVNPDLTERDYFLHLVPGQSYVVSVLAQESGAPVVIKEIKCDVECKNLRKDGPYYYLDVKTKEEGIYYLEIVYSVDGVVNRDKKQIIVSYDFIVVDSIVEYGREFRENSKINFVIQNNSDSLEEIMIESNLPEDIFKGVLVKANSNEKKVVALNIFTKNKGMLDAQFNMSINGKTIPISKNSMYVDYVLKDVFKSTTYSYMVLSPQLNLFAAINSFLSLLG